MLHEFGLKKKVTDFLRFCYLNIPCIRIVIIIFLMSFSSDEFTHLKKNSTTDVSVGFQRPYLCPSKGHQHGVSLQSFINLGITLFRISLIRKISHRPDSWRGFLYISSYLFFISQILDFLYWLVCIFFIIDGGDNENRDATMYFSYPSPVKEVSIQLRADWMAKVKQKRCL